MEENGGDFDIVKIRKTGSKTGQNRFRIFLLTFLNSLGQDGSNGTPFYAVGSILTSTFDLKNFIFCFCKKIILKS